MGFAGKTSTGKDEWLTPPELVKKIGTFDLDPCQPINPPFIHALNGYNKIDDGLKLPWVGRVFCNPPYGNGIHNWIDKCILHQNAIALIFAHTETRMFTEKIWNAADAILFIKGRLSFLQFMPDGSVGKNNTAGYASVLVAYGKECADLLENCNVDGKFIRLK